MMMLGLGVKIGVGEGRRGGLRTVEDGDVGREWPAEVGESPCLPDVGGGEVVERWGEEERGEGERGLEFLQG